MRLNLQCAVKKLKKGKTLFFCLQTIFDIFILNLFRNFLDFQRIERFGSTSRSP